jgi:hypothetical protein
VDSSKDTTVSSGGSEFLSRRTHNIGGLNDRLLLFVTSGALFIAGILLMGIAALGKEVHRWGRTLEARIRSERSSGG